MSYKNLVNKVIETHKSYPVDILNIGDQEGEYIYLCSHRHSYIRTVRDVANLFKKNIKETQILEIGSFLGVVSVSLAKLGFDVYAYDIPEFHASNNLRNLYERENINFQGGNLRHRHLPYEDDTFDCVVICETLEHLNFNPLPIINEINRVTKPEGFLYVGMPNIAAIGKRIKLMMGKSIHPPIESFFKQLDRTQNMVIGLHWREYSLQETIEIVEKMGYKVIKHYYFSGLDSNIELVNIKSIIKKILYLYESFKPYQVVIAQKKEKKKFYFWFTDVNS